MKIKNWKKLQHFKERTPPWVKLYRDILEQRDINMISDCSFRVLIGLWLLAAEDKDLEGNLPEIPDIAFRLRKSEKEITECLQELSAFLVYDDTTLISSQYQDDAPETETEAYSKEIEKEKRLRAEQKSSTPPLFKKLNPKDLEDDWLEKLLPPDNVIEMWNEIIVGESEKTKHIRVTTVRTDNIKRRNKDSLYKGQDWLDYFQRIKADSFCMGEKGWKATIDWALKPTSITKMLEGGYNG